MNEAPCLRCENLRRLFACLFACFVVWLTLGKVGRSRVEWWLATTFSAFVHACGGFFAAFVVDWFNFYTVAHNIISRPVPNV